MSLSVQPPHKLQSQVSWCSAQQITSHSSAQAGMDSPIPLLSVICIYPGFQSAIMCGNTQLALIRLSAEVNMNNLRNPHKLYLFTSLALKTSFQVGKRYAVCLFFYAVPVCAEQLRIYLTRQQREV